MKDIEFPEPSAFASSDGTEEPFEEESNSQGMDEEGSDHELEENSKERSPSRKLNGTESKNASYDVAPAQRTELSEPDTHEQAMKSADRDSWKEALESEMKAMYNMGVWELINPDPTRKPIPCKWIFKNKLREDGTLERRKARLVAMGNFQKSGVDYTELFAPVARHDSVRLLISIAVEEKLIPYQFDVKSACLCGKLEDTVHMKQPKGYEDGTDRVCNLRQSIYGLCQAPRVFHPKLKGVLLSLQLQQSKSDPFVFYRNEKERTIIGVYVDDGLILG